jgi:hypothetical protein
MLQSLRGGCGVVIGWFGPLFWPYADYDLFDYIYWPYAYDNFWPYAYDDVYYGIYGPYAYSGPHDYRPYADPQPPAGETVSPRFLTTAREAPTLPLRAQTRRAAVRVADRILRVVRSGLARSATCPPRIVLGIECLHGHACTATGLARGVFARD